MAFLTVSKPFLRITNISIRAISYGCAGDRMSEKLDMGDYLDVSLLLERFLSDCQAISEEIDGDAYSFTYIADTIAAIYYFREYDSADEFIQENKDFIDEERADWVRYMWKSLNSMKDEERSEFVIDSLTQISAVAD